MKQKIYEESTFFFKLLQCLSNFLVFGFAFSCSNISKLSAIFCPVFRISASLLNANNFSHPVYTEAKKMC